MNKNTWYSISENNVYFNQHENNSWLPNILREQPFPKNYFQNESVTVEGKAPVWMYAYTAISLMQNKAKEISIYQPHAGKTRIFPLDEHKDDNNKFFVQDKLNNSIDIIRFIPRLTNDPWKPSGQIHIPHYFKKKMPEHCCLTGQGANWMYASFAIQAYKAGTQTISCYVPRESKDKIILLYDKNISNNFIEYPEIVDHLKVNGTILGIVGDPNSGKSVCSAALAAIAYDLNINSWILFDTGKYKNYEVIF